MALDLKKFLTEELGFTEAEATEMLPKFEGERATKLEKSVLRQSDYSRQLDVEKKRVDDVVAAYNDKQERLNAELKEWASLSANEKAANLTQRAALEKSQQQQLIMRQRIERLATDAGLDPAEALKDLDAPVITTTPPRTPEATVPAFDPTKFVPIETYATMSSFMLTLPAELQQLSQEHHALTGEWIDTREIVAEIRARAGKPNAVLDPRAIWEEKYAIPEKRTARDTAARTAEITAAEQRGFERAQSESSLPVPPSRGTRSPLMRTLDGQKPHESVLKRPVPESGISAAVSAFRTGKYRQGDKKTA